MLTGDAVRFVSVCIRIPQVLSNSLLAHGFIDSLTHFESRTLAWFQSQAIQKTRGEVTNPHPVPPLPAVGVLLVSGQASHSVLRLKGTDVYFLLSPFLPRRWITGCSA
jgi:hypothetical protein